MPRSLKWSLIGLLYFVLLSLIFILNQNQRFYSATLGKVSSNYERTGDWDNYRIISVNKAFLGLTPENFENWDAGIYKCLKEKLYSQEEGCYHKVRGAFFPLFPLLWKFLSFNAFTVSIFNYFLFVIGTLLLLFIFYEKKQEYPDYIYPLLLFLPSAVIFIIPYSESLFFVTLAIAAYGMVKQKYWIYFVGLMLFSMVRPASVFVLLAILLLELLSLFKGQKIKGLFKEALLKALPLLTGFLLVMLIQYLSSGSWTLFLKAQAYWEGGFRPFTRISDWSQNGFGLNAFAIFFLSIPCLVYIVYSLISNKTVSFRFSGDKACTRGEARDYLFELSLLYITGIFLFTLMTSAGNLHSYFRFTMSTPFFYIILINFINRSKRIQRVVLFTLSFVMTALFLSLVRFGGNKLDFNYLGLWLMVLCTAYLLFFDLLRSRSVRTIVIAILMLACAIWNAYMINVFLSNGWIFT